MMIELVLSAFNTLSGTSRFRILAIALTTRTGTPLVTRLVYYG